MRLAMSEPRQMELFVLEYAAGIGASSKINVGVVIFERTGTQVPFAKARFVHDGRLIQRVDPDADIDVLASLFRDIEHRLDRPDCRQEMLRLIQDSFSNLLQVSEARPILVADDPSEEIDRLASLYLFPEACQ
jgi:hypothetical protein